MMLTKKTIYTLFFFILPLSLKGQTHPQNKTFSEKRTLSSNGFNNDNSFEPLRYKNGVGLYTPQGLFSLNLNFRLQNRLDFQFSNSSNSGPYYDWYIRRLRLKFSGNALSPRLKYAIQISFSNKNNSLTSMIKDALILYEFNDYWQFAFGQGKLPGNRQYLVSSKNQQFVSRSLVSSEFKLARDFGLFSEFETKIANTILRWQNSVTSGEGGSPAIPPDDKVFYVTRLEWLPFGAFSNDGDSFESDLAYEPNPKLSLGTSWGYLRGAARTHGNSGDILTTTGQADDPLVRLKQQVLFADALLKYQGHSLNAEWAYRNADSSIVNSKQKILTGQGLSLQFGKMLSQKFELALRYAHLFPDSKVQSAHPKIKRWTIGANYFLNDNKIKIQTNIGHSKNEKTFGRLQIELGI